MITKGTIDVIKEDPSDNRVLETAILGKVDYLVTGDKHLLRLHEFEGFKIIKSNELFNNLALK